MRLGLLFALGVLLAGCVQPLPETRIIVIQSSPEGTSSANLLILGIVEVEEEGPPVGHVVPVQVTVRAGQGDVYVDSPYEVAADTKDSILVAVHAAAFVAGLQADAFDYEVSLDERSGDLSGPSGGSQFALGFYVALNNLLSPEHPLLIRGDYAGTGTINDHGNIGSVGGVPAKAEALDGVVDVFAYPRGPVYESSGWFADPVDMDGVCAKAGLHCAQVETLVDLLDVATLEP